MKNPRTLLVLSLAGLVLTAANGGAQPAEPAKPLPPVPPAKPAPRPIAPDSVEGQFAAAGAALDKAKFSFALADSDFNRAFVRFDGGSRSLIIPKDNEDSKDLADTEE